MNILDTNEECLNVVERQDYQKDYVPQKKIIIGMQIALCLILVGMFSYVFITYPQPAFFALTGEDQLFVEAPLNEPQLSDAQILNWVTAIGHDLFTFNYNNVDRNLENVANYFDRRGWQGFVDFLKQGPQIQRVKNDKLIVSSKPLRSPLLLKEIVSEGRYIWHIQAPILLVFENVNSSTQVNVTLDVFITRVPSTESSIGIKITSFKGVVNQGR